MPSAGCISSNEARRVTHDVLAAFRPAVMHMYYSPPDGLFICITASPRTAARSIVLHFHLPKPGNSDVTSD